MYHRTPLPPALLDVMARQEGVVSRSQALCFVSREVVARRVRTGAWQRITPGVFAEGPPAPRQLLWAGHLLGGERSALGGRAALAAAGILAVGHPVAVWIPEDVRRVRRPGFEFRVDGLGRLTRARGTLPTVRLEDALLDLGEELPLQEWIGVVSDAVRSARVSPLRLREGAKARARLGGRRLLEAVIADLAGIESPLELRYLRDVERAHALPRARRQVPLLAGTRADLLYEEWGVIVELDGRIHLGSRFRDLARDNANSVLGRLTLRYGSVDVYGRPCLVAQQVGEGLAVRGWTGRVRPCRRCRTG